MSKQLLIKSFFTISVLLFSFECTFSQIILLADEISDFEKQGFEKTIKQLEVEIKNGIDVERKKQSIAEVLILKGSPTSQIINFVDSYITEPEKKFYFNLANSLVLRNERLDKALEYLDLEDKILYKWVANDAYSPPCTKCVKVHIFYKQKKYDDVIRAFSKYLPIERGSNLTPYDQPINYTLLGLSYYEIGNLDDSLNVFFELASQSTEPSPYILSLLKKVYLAKYKTESGLNEELTKRNDQWRFARYVKRYLLSESSPQFSLPNLGGQIINLSDYKGKIILLVFFKSQYQGSTNYLLSIDTVCQKYKDKNVACLGIDTSNSLAKDRIKWVEKELEGKSISFPILLDYQEQTKNKFKFDYNFYVLIDQNQKIKFRMGYWELALAEQLKYLTK